MNFYKRHLGDYAKDAGHLTMLEHGAYTLLLDRYYTTEKPIPNRVEALRVCRARTPAEREAVDAVLAEFFTTDGEAFANRRAEEEIAKASHQRTVNQELGKRGGRPKRTESVNYGETDSVPIHNPSQTPDSRLQTKPERADPSPGVARAPEEAPPEAEGQAPTAAGIVCRAMRRAGLPAVNPGDPRLLELLRQGATEAEFAGLAAEAAAKGKGFAWVLVALQSRRTEASAIALAPPAATTTPSNAAAASAAWIAQENAHRAEVERQRLARKAAKEPAA